MHPWFVGCQFHPEFTSNAARRPSAVHRLRARRPGAAGSGKDSPVTPADGRMKLCGENRAAA
jgi:GMP synthase-like glutamine amidotransferase